MLDSKLKKEYYLIYKVNLPLIYKEMEMKERELLVNDMIREARSKTIPELFDYYGFHHHEKDDITRDKVVELRRALSKDIVNALVDARIRLNKIKEGK